MKFIKTDIEGVFILEPRVFQDSRGYFLESYNEAVFKENGLDYHFVQDNESFSSYGTIRGLHFQKFEYAQAKLVRVIMGAVLDVVVDLRPNSVTYGKHIAVELSSDNKRQLLIPRGFAHGFSVLSHTAIFAYKCDNFYHASADAGLLWNDTDLKIDWKIPAPKAILSDKDTKHPCLKDLPICF
jgi:dTDP-4-dehydrorhamnose 3,5-epimerase